MTKAKPVQSFGSDSQDLEGKIITAIEAVGPRNVARIARMTGAHQETIRYKIKKQFASVGFRFQAEVDYRKIGLTLHWGKVMMTTPHQASAARFFNALNESAYLVHFARVLPQGHFNVAFALPEGKEGEFRRFLDAMKTRKFIADFELEKVVAQKHKPFDPSFFNFQAGGWEVDWKRVRASHGAKLGPIPETKAMSADPVDLLLIKELQRDGLQHVVGIAKALGVNPKTMEYHYRVHVLKQGLIPKYRIRWMNDLQRKPVHRTIFTSLTFRKLDQAEYGKVQEAISKIPYLWAEDLLSDGTYVATLSIPTSDLIETSRYVDAETGHVGPKVEIGFLDPAEWTNFTIPHEMYGQAGWAFDIGKMEKSVMKEVGKGIEK